MSDFHHPQDDEVDAQGAGPTIGQVLRHAREERGESLVDVAYALKLAPRQVEAMEADRFDLLPGAAFIKGFLRNYARYLGVHGEPMIAGLHNEQSARPAQLTPVTNAHATLPTERAEHRILRPVAVVVFGILIALAAGWYFDWFQVDDVDAVEERTAEVIDTSPASALTPEPPPAPSQQAPAQEVSPPYVEPLAPMNAADDTRAGAADSGESSTALETGGSEAEGEPATGPETAEATAESDVVPESEGAAVEAEAPAEDVAAASGEGRLVFRLEGDSWIQVRDAAGIALYTGTGVAGTTRSVQGDPPFSIVVGNASMVALEYDGEPVDLAPHTRSGGVARMTVE